ncbi:MAG TPA: M48 family metalloprotease [Gemmatimonadaceae bacterium]|nr:M48 family metalloprotease [Gemmatimonadaceae bacterium]
MIERAAWALDRVRRVQERLNQIRPEKVQLETTILEIAPPLAFTTVGRHVYLSRHLLERLPTDDAVAFVLAHEAGHHDLGHLDLFAGWSRVLPRTNSSAWVAILANYLEHHAYGPSREDAADAYAVSVCMRAGYNGGLSVQALTILETLALDAGDINGVYGPENLLDPTDPKRDSAAYLIQRWVWTHLHGYNPLHERVAKVRKLVRECAT